ncbi:YCII-related domain-containing protein [Diaminobutyricimonas aerilata]|uniref:YCII-related domain-containing protein n=1 Tax=Diaminobutyricimonas aerilata TaxID=1162967 RepID=A0A2M9CJV0_9MICO|nr:YciI family protein [Diaminobutyricimonas aerilata]PJJ72138.1 YCII-related domain-containing protein [Diaminobutyricimonas aerilata]
MNWYLMRLLPHRADFAETMTADESAAMERHFAYWAEHLAAGTALILSPVGDPDGVWGMCVVRVADREAVSALEASDPAILAGIGRYESLELLDVMVRE